MAFLVSGRFGGSLFGAPGFALPGSRDFGRPGGLGVPPLDSGSGRGFGAGPGGLLPPPVSPLNLPKADFVPLANWPASDIMFLTRDPSGRVKCGPANVMIQRQGQAPHLVPFCGRTRSGYWIIELDGVQVVWLASKD